MNYVTKEDDWPKDRKEVTKDTGYTCEKFNFLRLRLNDYITVTLNDPVWHEYITCVVNCQKNKNVESVIIVYPSIDRDRSDRYSRGQTFEQISIRIKLEFSAHNTRRHNTKSGSITFRSVMRFTKMNFSSQVDGGVQWTFHGRQPNLHMEKPPVERNVTLPLTDISNEPASKPSKPKWWNLISSWTLVPEMGLVSSFVICDRCLAGVRSTRQPPKLSE